MAEVAKNMTVHTQNERGEWVPAIPLPIFMHYGVMCDCGKRFLRRQRYREHYAYAHILGMGSGR